MKHSQTYFIRFKIHSPRWISTEYAKKSREQSKQQEEAEDREDEDGQVERWRTEGNDKGTARRGIKCADGVTVVVKLRKTV